MVTMVWPGPSSRATLIAPQTLMPVEPPRTSPSCNRRSKMTGIISASVTWNFPRPAGGDRADEGVDLAVGLPPDLRPGRLVMAAPVGGIVELVGPDRAIRIGGADLAGEALGVAHVVHRIGVGNGGDEA